MTKETDPNGKPRCFELGCNGCEHCIDDEDAAPSGVAEPVAAESASAWKSRLITEACSKWSGNQKVEAGDIIEWIADFRMLATPIEAEAPHCLTCSDHGSVGRADRAEPCPDCTPPGSLTEAQKAVAPELCPYCDGSGDSTSRAGGGPDTWDEPCTCPRCKGAQTLRAAYDTLAEELPPLQLKVAQLGIFHSHATRYGWAPNQTTGMESFAKLAAQWLAENETTSSASTEVVGLTDGEIEAGRRDTFSTENPFCPCDSKTMRKAARWAERALAKKNGWRMGGEHG